MQTDKTESDLPLKYRTPVAWAAGVLDQPMALLNDHAHLEKKAATNALELLNRWPEPNPPENWVTAMTAVARDEVTAGKGVEVLADHAAVVERDAVVGDERGHLAERIPGDDRLVAVDRVGIGGQELDAIGEAELIGRNETFAHERGGSGIE